MLSDVSTGGSTDMGGSRELHFSIIIPAHNEEKYIGATLEHAANLSYPVESFEVIVVENGSSDRTYDHAKQFEGPNIRVFKNDRAGVSAAKNFGIDQLSPLSDWVVFLDADTILKPGFLRDLDAKLRASRKPLAVGTTKVLPLGGGWHARTWFACYDLLHRLGGSYAIQIAKRSLFPTLRFDEHLIMGEDLLLIKQARKLGKFFYVPTPTVYTSTRRFDSVGYWRLYFQWASFEILPRRLQKRRGYKVVR
ncbi:glycosyltransferase [Mycobacterium basiliense]|nr:glycosyltransferase [Mycobacterium basiliense]